MAPTCFRTVIDRDLQVLLRVLQTFARPGLCPTALVMTEIDDAFQLVAHFGKMPADLTDTVLLRLAETPGVRKATTAKLGGTIG